MRGFSGRLAGRLIGLAAAAAVLGGCSLSMDSFRPTPTPVTIQLESLPPGAEAVTSAGPSCKTPCSVPVPPGNLTVTFNLPKYQPVTVPVEIAVIPGDVTTPPLTTIDPNPVFAELQRAGPPPRGKRAPAPKKRVAVPATAPAGNSPFPPPPGR